MGRNEGRQKDRKVVCMSNRRTQTRRSVFHLEKQLSYSADLIRNLCLQILNLCLQRHVLIVQGLIETGKSWMKII